jgi:hypothetical protein
MTAMVCMSPKPRDTIYSKVQEPPFQGNPSVMIHSKRWRLKIYLATLSEMQDARCKMQDARFRFQSDAGIDNASKAEEHRTGAVESFCHGTVPT